MGDKMIPIPFGDMLERIVTEYTADSTIFGIHKDQFFKKSSSFKASFFDQPCGTPVGPAAGPHTQLAQNILASYLSGGRFIELKTVQILDTLEIDKPCIDARDEGYNVEWSTEFTLEQAYDEYLKAWILIHVLETLFPSGYQGEPDYSCIFNMSVGYDLAGIKTERMQTFINNLMSSEEHPLYAAYIEELVNFANDSSFLSDTPF
ncbi:MAG: putative selenate reductase subunit YgfK, partial [Spirochaetia bacterium]|nr:putative selenate reductase subunit YgfK [Spirochaetia bacterium]